MNKFTCAVAISMLMAGTLFTSCEPSGQTEAEAQEELQEAQEELQKARQEAQKSTEAEEWRVFKNEMELKIVENENRIAEIRVQMNKPGKIFDEVYAKRIDALEEKNKELRERIVAYEKDQSDWEAFKREFKHDMDELGKALNDLVEDNKN